MPHDRRPQRAAAASANWFSGAATKSPADPQGPQDAAAPGAAGRHWPGRPHWTIVNGNIPFFLIGRNKSGFWVARECSGRSGGIFLSKTAAIRFAKSESAPHGCAWMMTTEALELDLTPRPD